MSFPCLRALHAFRPYTASCFCCSRVFAPFFRTVKYDKTPLSKVILKCSKGYLRGEVSQV